jgi:hypothetical protein
MSSLKSFTASLALVSLSACASVNPVALAKLAALDTLAADPAAISVAARLPESLKLRDGDLVMTIAINGKESGVKLSEEFKLDVSDAEAGGAGTVAAGPRERLQTAKIAEADLARLKAVQEKARVHKTKSSGKGEGTFSIGIAGGCKTAEPPAGPLLISVYLKTDAEMGFYPVIGELDLRKQFGEKIIGEIVACK